MKLEEPLAMVEFAVIEVEGKLTEAGNVPSVKEFEILDARTGKRRQERVAGGEAIDRSGWRGAVSLVDAEKRLKRRGRGWLADAKQRHGSHHETGRDYSATNGLKPDLAH